MKSMNDRRNLEPCRDCLLCARFPPAAEPDERRSDLCRHCSNPLGYGRLSPDSTARGSPTAGTLPASSQLGQCEISHALSRRSAASAAFAIGRRP